MRASKAMRRVMVFQRIAGRHQPPHPIKLQRVERLLGDEEMAVMDRVEGAAIKANRLPGRDTRAAARGHGG
jgi:hypothetical protein